MQRVDEWTVLRRALIDAAATVDGAELRYRPDPAVRSELARLVAAERECCARGDIGWDLEIDDQALTVRITVPVDVRGSAEAAQIFSVLAGS